MNFIMFFSIPVHWLCSLEENTAETTEELITTPIIATTEQLDDDYYDDDEADSDDEALDDDDNGDVDYDSEANTGTADSLNATFNGTWNASHVGSNRFGQSGVVGGGGGRQSYSKAALYAAIASAVLGVMAVIGGAVGGARRYQKAQAERRRRANQPKRQHKSSTEVRLDRKIYKEVTGKSMRTTSSRPSLSSVRKQAAPRTQSLTIPASVRKLSVEATQVHVPIRSPAENRGRSAAGPGRAPGPGRAGGQGRSGDQQPPRARQVRIETPPPVAIESFGSGFGMATDELDLPLHSSGFQAEYYTPDVNPNLERYH